MTKEEKQLLLKDLCARLQYGVKLDFYSIATNEHYVSILLGIEPNNDDKPIIAKVNDGAYTLGQDHIKPYLRPMSSMNSEEWVEYCDASLEDEKSWVWAGKEYKFTPVTHREEFLNSHHFDYRGLIERGLALEAPEDMYKHFGDMDVVVTSVEHKDKP